MGSIPTQRALDEYTIAPGPHVAVAGDELTLEGIPYRYGFAYLPLMFLIYLPMRRVTAGVETVRFGNALLIAAGIVGLIWLVPSWSPGRSGAVGAERLRARRRGAAAILRVVRAGRCAGDDDDAGVGPEAGGSLDAGAGWPLSLACATAFVLIAFSRVRHLSYVWAAYSPACGALAMWLFGTRDE